jgi:hypothetical protein
MSLTFFYSVGGGSGRRDQEEEGGNDVCASLAIIVYSSLDLYSFPLQKRILLVLTATLS